MGDKTKAEKVAEMLPVDKRLSPPKVDGNCVEFWLDFSSLVNHCDCIHYHLYVDDNPNSAEDIGAALRILAGETE
jgi:hypothetical protein